MPSSRSRNSDDPVSVSSARLTRLTLAQPLLERLELLTDLTREPIAEAGEVRLRLVELRAGLVEVDAQRFRDGPVVEPVKLEVLGLGHVAQRRLERLRLVVAATEDPGQHARVLAE